MFGLLIVLLKFILLALDPLPKFFLGDSICYISTALEGWIPDDRSYFYGFVIRWVALSTGSLTSLLVLQTFISASNSYLAGIHLQVDDLVCLREPPTSSGSFARSIRSNWCGNATS